MILTAKLIISYKTESISIIFKCCKALQRHEMIISNMGIFRELQNGDLSFSKTSKFKYF